jgi:hypothetical protein
MDAEILSAIRKVLQRRRSKGKDQIRQVRKGQSDNFDPLVLLKLRQGWGRFVFVVAIDNGDLCVFPCPDDYYDIDAPVWRWALADPVCLDRLEGWLTFLGVDVDLYRRKR